MGGRAKRNQSVKEDGSDEAMAGTHGAAEATLALLFLRPLVQMTWR